ncbi:alpha/beta hydrolase-fold protein [Alkalihalobacillus sp. AL-G]|uniref:alpha/beta hydrolase-fold protein n=1 Tax=Alkalihalobacillus sp. AL-G TaxID=2926399 RepID=UPI00272AFFF8|nr:alpha/beta hydrolase-fold protein [Alkalihalobacillus sp. AL-G]WLD93075.1 alpha/beta hydrolase-fold protein [Alkalihalobacillus sp. AL-G]
MIFLKNIFIFLKFCDRLIVTTNDEVVLIFTKTENAFSSRILQQKITFHHLGYQSCETGERVVLFVQDGVDYLELGSFEQSLQTVVKETNFKGQLDAYMIHPGDSWARYHYYHPNQADHKRFVAFFHEEFYPAHIPSTKGLHKVGVLGDSLAALVNVSIAAEQPERFTHLLLQSTAYEPVKLLGESLPEQVMHWKVYQLVGLKEDDFVSPLTGQKLRILTENRKLNKRLLHLQVQVEYVEKDEEHSWEFWRQNLQKAITYFLTK